MPPDPDDDRLPPDGTGLNPRDREAVPALERHLLACCMQGNPEDNGIDDAAELVTPDDFVLAAHGVVFAAALDVRRERSVVLVADVYVRLTQVAARDQRAAAHLADLGADLPLWLAETLELEPVTGWRARYYATYVREASLFRRLRGVAAEISRLAVMPTGPAADVLGDCERLLFDLTDAGSADKETTRDARRIMAEAGERVDLRQESGGALGGLSCGYADLDHILGGLRPGQLVVLGARPGGGKTALGLSVAARVALAGHGVVFFSMEMPADQIGDRLLAMGSGVSMSRLTRGDRLTDAEAARVATATGPAWVGGSALFVDDAPDQPAQRVAAKTRRAVRRHGVGLVVVDYLQLLRPENPRENRTQQVGLAARRMKQVARECGVPVLLLCQLNRQVEQRADGKPKLSDLRESGEIEQHADAVLLLHTHPDQTPDLPVWLVDVVVAKNRNGPVGEATLAYRRSVMTFENAARESREAA